MTRYFIRRLFSFQPALVGVRVLNFLLVAPPGKDLADHHHSTEKSGMDMMSWYGEVRVGCELDPQPP